MVAVGRREGGERKRHDAERGQRRSRQNGNVFAERRKNELALACGDFGGARLDVADLQPLRTFHMALQNERLQSATPHTHTSILRGRSAKHVVIGSPFVLEKHGESPGINHVQIRRLSLDSGRLSYFIGNALDFERVFLCLTPHHHAFHIHSGLAENRQHFLLHLLDGHPRFFRLFRGENEQMMRNVLHDDADAAEPRRGWDSPEEIELSGSEKIVFVEICQEELNAVVLDFDFAGCGVGEVLRAVFAAIELYGWWVSDCANLH